MSKLATVLRRESPVVLAREFAWRTRRNWGKKRFLARIGQDTRPVHFRPVKYYAPDPADFAESTRTVITDFANEIAEGRYPFLGYGTVAMGPAPNWSLDFVSGKEWPSVALENTNCVRFDGSDVKAPYELSRLQFLPILGKAYVLTGNERYRSVAKQRLSTWLEDNPVGVGVNWSMAMEAALRGMSICFTLNLLSPFRPDEQQWLAQAARSLWEHMAFIEAHNEFSHFVRSNHYLSNIVGLLCLATFLEGPGMSAKRKRYRELVEKEIHQQVYKDGGDCEASTGYHVLVSQMFTSALILLRADAVTPSESFLKRLHAMYRWMEKLSSASGQLPNVGDCDDGRVELLLDDLQQMLSLPVPERNSLRISNLLGLGACLFGDPAVAREDAKWYGFKSKAAVGARAAAQSAALTVLPQSGIAVANVHRSELIFFAIPNGINGKGSHTHNDKLSFVLRLNGQEVICDSGTGCYTRDPAMRNRFRQTRAHNTVMVDGQEQNAIHPGTAGLFVVGDEAKVSPIEKGKESGALFLRASHTGYSALGVDHTRTIRLPEASEAAFIEDRLSGSGTHSFEINYQLAPGWRVEKVEKDGLEIHCHLSGPQKLRISITAPGELQADAYDSSVSMTYLGVTPATRLCFSGAAEFPVKLITQISWAN